MAKIPMRHTLICRTSLHFAARALLFSCAVSLCSHAFAQEPTPLNSHPPPQKLISKEERARLDAEKGVKKRTRIALELMEARLKRAEALNAQESWDAMFDELGSFHALVDDTFIFLDTSDKDRDKVLNNFKRLEIGIRSFGPRIEVLRRVVPDKYNYYLYRLALHLRRTRTKAVESFFEDSVVADQPPVKN